MGDAQKERYYIVPKRVFKKDINMFETLSIIFVQRYKDFNNESVFTIATLLNSLGLEVHHRKISHIKDCLISIANANIIITDIDTIVRADKNAFIRVVFNDYFEEGFIAIHPIEFDIILDAMKSYDNYNLLNVFTSIKQDATTMSYMSNTYSSTSISYKSLYKLCGVKSPNNLQVITNILCELGIMDISVATKDNKTKITYSFKTVKQLNKLHLPT